MAWKGGCRSNRWAVYGDILFLRDIEIRRFGRLKCDAAFFVVGLSHVEVEGADGSVGGPG